MSWLNSLSHYSLLLFDYQISFWTQTTALKILSLSHTASGGLALVAGYDVTCEEISVVERMGNCPQFDIIWPGQSVQRHLEFFSELKGLPKNQTKEIAHGFAAAVGLGSPEVYHRAAGSLSGGMRRRLSIAISLIGAPSVLLLDGEFKPLLFQCEMIRVSEACLFFSIVTFFFCQRI
jgi:ABC-type Na+ transport system ATPase subunit NatA